jgi:hypothetical protein
VALTISATSLLGAPMGAFGPERAKKAPILMGSSAWAQKGATPSKAATQKTLTSLSPMSALLLVSVEAR